MTKFRHQPISKFVFQELDPDLFHELFDILHDGCFEGNYAATARCLSISIPTARKYARTPPTQHWWNHILHKVLSDIYQQMRTSKVKKQRKRAEIVGQALSRAGLHKLKEYADYNAANQQDAVRHLLVELTNARGHMLSTDQLRKPRWSGGFSMRALRQASVILDLDKTTEGFGEDKRTYWSLPTQFEREASEDEE